MEHSLSRPSGLSIILPCYNQASVLASTLYQIRTFCEEKNITYEIIAVNDGSTDDTYRILREQEKEGVRVYTHAKNLGKGKAVQTGVLAARYPITLFLDADLAIPIEETEKFLRVLQEDDHTDIVIASRFVEGHTTLVPVFWHRKILEHVFRMLRKIIIGLHSVQDTQCGFKMFRTAKAKKVFGSLTRHRFSFDAELLFIAHRRKLAIKELPVALQNPPQSSIRLGKDSFQMFLDLFAIRWKSLIGWYQEPVFKGANITLDDFGMNTFVNERILGVTTHSRVARVAVMTEGTLPEAACQALLQSGKKIDIHLELPVVLGERNLHGNILDRSFRFLKAVLVGDLRPEKVEASWRQQLKHFQELFGRNPDGINSHEHTHFFPLFFGLTLRIAKEYNIPFVRMGRKISWCAHLVSWVLNILRLGNQAVIGRPKNTSTRLFSFDWGIHPNELMKQENEVLYHIERDEEWVHLQG